VVFELAIEKPCLMTNCWVVVKVVVCVTVSLTVGADVTGDVGAGVGALVGAAVGTLSQLLQLEQSQPRSEAIVAHVIP
jgi:hypothetical protein